MSMRAGSLPLRFLITARNFEVQFDFIDHKLIIQTSWGTSETFALKAESVADFYAEFMSALRSLGIAVKIWTMPQEVPNPVRFDQRHAACFLRPRICTPLLANPDFVR